MKLLGQNYATKLLGLGNNITQLALGNNRTWSDLGEEKLPGLGSFSNHTAAMGVSESKLGIN